MVLSDFAADVRAIADVEAFGVVLGRPDDHAQLVTRHRAGVSAHYVPVQRLAAPFLPSVDRVTMAAPMSAHVDLSHPVFERLAGYGIECLLVVPLPSRLGMLWIGGRGADAFTAEQVAQFERLVAGVAAAIEQGDPLEARLDDLERIDAVEQILPLVAGSLDIREVFHRISGVARTALPHDAATIQILSDERHARLYALDGLAGDHLTDVFATNYAPVFNQHFQFSLHDDLLANPAERDKPTAKAGMRSALRLPLRLDGKVGGALEFSAGAVGAYRETDVPVARRIADYVTLAISHQRMADEARRAAELRARSENLMALDELLAALGGVLDIREVFDRVSDIANKVLPHDAAIIIVPTGEGMLAKNYALRGFGDGQQVSESRVRQPELLTDPWDFRLYDDLATHPAYADSLAVRAGMHSALLLPVRLDGPLQAFLSFLSRACGRFTRDDVAIGRRIADHVALAISHQRLADESRRSEELRARAANLELLDDLLAALTDAAPLHELFDRVSAFAKKVIAHDAMALAVLLADGVKARRYATSGMDRASQPDIIDVPPAFLDPKWEYELVADGLTNPEPHNRDLATQFDFRSALRVPIRVDGKVVAGLGFLARQPGVYQHSDIVTARRLADRFALCLARERQFEAVKRADEATKRAAELESRVRALTDELDARTGYRRVVGQSVPWKQVLTQATQVAGTDTTVLLLGESGTGKEVVARFIHRASSRPGRADGPFIALNCAALPEQLLEAELFGYERGAFTGATQSKPGQLEQAAGGTLFLDEVGEMSAPAQAKFLRVLQEREFQRLGGTRVLKTDARIVAATNRDLLKAMAAGQFREDLFYRLNVFAIRLPPLRERREDVLALGDAFLSEYGRSLGRPPSGISKDARRMLTEYDWPGNVRELRNILERAAILCDGGLITSEHLALGSIQRPAVAAAPGKSSPVGGDLASAPDRASPPALASGEQTGDLASMERTMIEQALQNARYNKSKAAAALGLTRAQLYVRMRRHGLE